MMHKLKANRMIRMKEIKEILFIPKIKVQKLLNNINKMLIFSIRLTKIKFFA